MHYFSKSLSVAALALVGNLTACDRLGTTSERMASEDPIACGGFAGLECPDGLVCVDDPDDDCDPKHGGADCGGICEPAQPAFCGGFAGIACPEGQVCADDPNDDCDPENGGADCGGICEPKHPHKPHKPHHPKPHKPHHDTCKDPDRSYVSHSPATCAAIRFICEADKSPFFDDCGCGCE